METVDLSTDDGLRRACEAVERENPRDGWRTEVKEYLREIADSLQTPERFASEKFQRLLWIDNPIAESHRAGRKEVEDAISGEEFRQRFLELYRGISGRWSNPPRTGPISVEALVDLAQKVRDLLEENCGFKPHFALYRALAALFPTKFTTIASLEGLNNLAKRMAIDPRRSLGDPEKVLEQHRQVLNQLEKVRETIDPNSLSEVAQRMTLPWGIVELVKSDEETQPSDDTRPQEVNAEEEGNLPSIRIPEFSEINEQLGKAGHFPPDLCRLLHLGLWANSKRHFAILTGISGSGKTLLAQKYAEALTGTEKPPRVCVVPVQPGWTDPSFLLGYPNPLKGDSYERTRFLDLLLSAKDKPSLPHVAILDEMNLSHPEQYLAPVLSAMETDNAVVEPHGRRDDFDGVPCSIPYPSNLILIGTVNMDETTMGLSDKVLDRAFTLEFWDIDVDAWPGWNSHGLSEDRAGQVKVILKELMTALKPARLHFGYRVIDEVLAFLKQREQQAPDWDFTKALDGVIYAKVLPKLRGDDSPRIQTAFDECKKVLDARNLEECTKKVEELKADLESTGSARFWR